MKERFAAFFMSIILISSLTWAEFSLGETKEAIKRDTGEGAKSFAATLRLAEKGDVEAQFELGKMYQQGLGVPQDPKEAAKWYRLAAEKGHAAAQLSLGLMYFGGQGVPKDPEEAIKWLRQAAEQKDTTAQFFLGVIYISLLDLPEAVKWLRQAAELGETNAQFVLGSIYEDGGIAHQDLVLAYTFYNLSASGGDAEARKKRDALIKRMTPEQIEAAQAISRNWQPGKPLPLGTLQVKSFSEDIKALAMSLLKSASGNEQATAVESSISGDASCRPRGPTIRCQSRCINGDCVITYENGCKVRVQVQPRFDPLTNQWTYPSPPC